MLPTSGMLNRGYTHNDAKIIQRSGYFTVTFLQNMLRLFADMLTGGLAEIPYNLLQDEKSQGMALFAQKVAMAEILYTLDIATDNKVVEKIVVEYEKTADNEATTFTLQKNDSGVFEVYKNGDYFTHLDFAGTLKQLQQASIQSLVNNPARWHLSTAIVTELNEQLNKLAAIVIQSKIRTNFATEGQKKGKKAEINTLLDSQRNIVAIKSKLSPERQLPFMKMPPEMANGPAGGYKKITHGNDELVVFTEQKPIYEDIDQRANNLTLIKNNKLVHIMPQYWISDTQMVATNLGEKDLFEMIKVGNRFSFKHFLPLLREIDCIHANGFAHRDIKPENIIFHKDEMYLIDLDSMGQVGTFKNDFGTPACLPEKLWGTDDNAARDQALNVWKKDQYTTLDAMIWSVTGRSILDNRVPNYNVIKNTVIPLLENTSPYWEELINFMWDPEHNSLTQPLLEYFKNLA